MKRLPQAAIDRIVDFSAEAAVSLPPYALEKDHHVVDAMRIIAQMPPNELFRPVFCGGTCLSKAYGVLERMSEDVDFKIAPTPAAKNLSRTRLREELGAYGRAIEAALVDGGFGEGAIERNARDSNSYISLQVAYESAFDKPHALRSHLLIELTHTKLAGDTQRMPVGLLMDKLATGAYPDPLLIECVSPIEALAEKLVSFPRRLALQLSRHPDPRVALRPENRWDSSLVRHLYDVEQLIAARPELAADAEALAKLVQSAIAKDRADFANQHPQFVADPGGELRRALEFAKASEELADQYARFVGDMVYADPARVPAYTQALGAFKATLARTLDLVAPAAATTPEPEPQAPVPKKPPRGPEG